jgi:hypothetical protein
MKRLLFLLLFLSSLAGAQCTTTTPNQGFIVPAYNCPNWNTSINSNFYSLDSLISNIQAGIVPNGTFADKPATCAPGALYVATDLAPTGDNILVCGGPPGAGSANTWYPPSAIGLPTATAAGEIPVAIAAGTSYTPQTKVIFDIRDCTVAICGVVPGPTADFCAAVNGAWANSSTGFIIDARNPGAFATVNGSGLIPQVMCLSDWSSGIYTGPPEFLLLGNYDIVTSVTLTTGSPVILKGYPTPTAKLGSGSQLAGTWISACSQSGGCPVGSTCPGAGCVPQFNQNAELAAGGPVLDTSPVVGGTVTVSSSAVTCPSPLPPGFNQTGTCHTVTGTAGVFTSSLVGGAFIQCVQETPPGTPPPVNATCPENASGGAGYAAFIVGYTNSNSITIIGSGGGNGGTGWAGVTTSGSPYIIYHPTISPLIWWDGAYSANSSSRDGFADELEDITIDCELVPYCWGLYTTNAQERAVPRRVNISLAGGIFTPSPASATTVMGGFFSDRSMQPNGISGPAHFGMEKMEVSAGAYVNGTVGCPTACTNLPYGYVFEGWTIPRNLPTDGPNDPVEMGTVIGGTVTVGDNNKWFQDAVWIDGVSRFDLSGGQCGGGEMVCTEVGGETVTGITETPITAGVHVHDMNSANLTTPGTKKYVWFHSNTQGGTVDNLNAQQGSTVMVEDDAPSGITLTSGTCTGPTPANNCTLAHYSQNVNYMNGVVSLGTTFANLPASPVLGQEQFCTSCVPTSTACSASSAANCVCVNGTGQMFAKYENYQNAGNNWYCH